MFSAAVGQLAEDYRLRGLAAAVARFESMRLHDRRLRLATNLFERVVPVRRLADELLYYGDVLERDGLGPGSRSALERWNLFPRLELQGAAWRVLCTQPFLAFGNHPAGVEAAFFSALLDREDVYFLAGAHVKQVAPSVAHRVIAVDNTSTCARTRSGARFRDSFFHGVEKQVWAPTDDAAAKAQNRAAVERVVQLVGSEGAGVHLFPAGSMDPCAKWQRGIGRIVGELKRMGSGPTSSVFLVPVVYRVSPIHVMASELFPSRSALRRLAQLRTWTWTGPPWVFVPRPIPLSELTLDAAASPETLTGALQQLWQSAAVQARAAIPQWTPLRGPRTRKSPRR